MRLTFIALIAAAVFAAGCTSVTTIPEGAELSRESHREIAPFNIRYAARKADEIDPRIGGNLSAVVTATVKPNGSIIDVQVEDTPQTYRYAIRRAVMLADPLPAFDGDEPITYKVLLDE